MEVLSSRVIIATPDLPVLRSFYESVIGLHPYREYGTGGRVQGVVLFLGGGFLELVSGDRAPDPGSVRLWLQVRDLQAEEGRLAAAGVTVRKPRARMPWGLDELWICDPEGRELVIVEVPPDHPLRRRV